MKKIILFLIIVLGLGLSSCSKEKSPNEVNVYMPDGTPALALAKMLDEGFTYEDTKTNFHIVQASEIAARVGQDSCDLAILPTTAAATLYQAGKDLKLASVNVFGNLFITGPKEVSALEDLKGKRILTTGATTLQMVEYVLKNNNIPYEESGEAVEGKVSISIMNDASEIIPLLKQSIMKNTELYGVLGEPQVTKAQGVIPELKIAVDLQKEYKSITGYDGYPQACLIVKDAFVNQYRGYVDAFLEVLESNSFYLNQNTTKLPEVFKKHESNLANMTFTADTIQRCNVRLERSNTVKDAVKEYVKSLINKDLDDTFFL